jgi:hypothetical protein
MADPEFADPGAITGAAPDEKRRRDERERDDYIERPTP